MTEQKEQQMTVEIVRKPATEVKVRDMLAGWGVVVDRHVNVVEGRIAFTTATGRTDWMNPWAPVEVVR